MDRRVYRGAELVTDHYLLISKIKSPKPYFQKKTQKVVQEEEFKLQLFEQESKWQLFQEEILKVISHENQNSSMVERQARDLEVRVRIPFQVQIFLLTFNKVITSREL